MAEEAPHADTPLQTSSTGLEQQLTEVESRIKPASREMIQKMLTAVAVTLQLEVPTNEALRVYLHLFEQYPEDLLRLAGEKVLREHHYPRFPFPADFCKHIDQIYRDRLDTVRWWKRTLADRRRGVTIRSEERADRGPRLLGGFLKTPKEKK